MNINNIPKEISADQLNQMIKKGYDIRILDVREYKEWEICHIEGAENIPMNLIDKFINKISREIPTVVICHHGVRSKRVINYLKIKGYKNLINLDGGIHSWAENINPNMYKY